MLDYEWGNPSTIMITGNDEAAAAAAESEQTHRQIFDHYNSHPFLPDHLISQAPPGPTPTTTATTSDFSLLHDHQQFHLQPHHHIHQQHHHQQQQHSLFDTLAFSVASSSHFPPAQPQPPARSHHSMFSLDPLPTVHAGNCGPGGGLLLLPKSEDVGRSMDFSVSRIGLNLGGRTYFSSSEDDFVSQLYRRPRPLEPGSTMSFNNNSPRCQAEGCNADLSHAKHYHRRHKVCEFHSKAATVIASGLTQRFCQQCSRCLP